MSQEHNVSREYCAVRSGGIERVQQMAERRLDGHGQKLEDLTSACIRLTAAVERVTLILEKQDQRLARMENRDLFTFFGSGSGKMLLRFGGIFLLVLLSAAVGINIFQIIKEVL